MQLIDIKVRDDWQESIRQRMVENTRLWRLVQLVAILSAGSVFLLSLLRLPSPWEIILRFSLSFALFLTFSLWTAYRSQPGSFRTVLLVFSLLIFASIIAGYTFLPAINHSAAYSFSWPIQLVVFIPAIGLLILKWSGERFPAQIKQLGFYAEQWSLNAIVGTSTGGSLGFHFLLAAFLLSGFSDKEILDLPFFFWTTFFRLGLGALGEEFLLRGVAFPLLFERSEQSFWKTAWQIAVLNVLIYIVPVMQMPGAFWGTWMVAYLLVFSITATFLRYRMGSLISCITCNIAFNMVIVTVIQW